MILGMSTFTLLHGIISLVGILTGLIVLAGMLGSKRLAGSTALFLATTVLTSVTGFFSRAIAFCRPTSSVGCRWRCSPGRSCRWSVCPATWCIRRSPWGGCSTTAPRPATAAGVCIR